MAVIISIYGINFGVRTKLKAHKPEKNYPMRAVVSTIASPAYGTSKYLVKIIQSTLKTNTEF